LPSIEKKSKNALYIPRIRRLANFFQKLKGFVLTVPGTNKCIVFFCKFVYKLVKKMGVPELKHKIQLQLDLADERVLRIVSSVFDNYLNEIVSYDANGNALTLSEYHNKVEEGLEDIKYNRVISQENLIEEMKIWKNE
jgi:hypothetical protein